MTDYTKYLDWPSVSVSEAINVPTVCNFTLYPIDKLFVVPVVRAYVNFYSTLTQKSLYTGFVSSTPKRSYKGRAAHVPTYAQGQQLQYDITCTSDEHLLNIKAIPFIPAFVNRAEGDILKSLANILCSGYYDTSMVSSGDLVPYFSYTPSQSWSEVAKHFGDGSRRRYKAKNKKLWYVPYGDLPLGIEYDETKGQGTFAPKELDTTILAVPTVNDVTIIGQTEAGNNREDYVIGDGFTANVPLLHQVFKGASTMLLQESWSNASLNTQQWFLLDPGINFDFTAGALNVVDTSSPGALGTSYLSMNNGVELAGGLDIQNGEVTFNDHCDGVIGGLYNDSAFDAASLVSGFKIVTSGAVVFPSPGPSGNVTGVGGVTIQPWFNGAAVGPGFVTKPGHNYVLQSIVHAPQYTRYTRMYRTLDGEEFGGTESTTLGSITYVIQDYDILAATGFFYAPDVTQVSINNVDLPAFAVYALVNNQKMNCTISNTTLALMPLGGLSALVGPSGLFTPTGLILPMLPADSGEYIGGVIPWPSSASANIFDPPLQLDSEPQILVLGNGFNLQAAQITAGNSSDTLAFYAQSTPAAGTPVRFQSWEGQAAVSRLQASASIEQEKFVVGDDGIRSAIVTDLNPLPRTSEDCDNAALAFLSDRSGILYDGTYTCTSLFFTGLTLDGQYWPTVGRFFNANAPGRGIVQETALVTTLKISILSAQDEYIQFEIGFGADLNLEKVLKNFVDLQPLQVLSPKDKANPPNPRFTQDVDNTFLPDLNNVYADLNGITESQLSVMVQDDYFGVIEVRRLDTNWGRGLTPDFIAYVSGPQFTLPRTQYDQVWYLRPVLYAGGVPPSGGIAVHGDVTTSRRSKVLRVRWPIRPSPPALVSVTTLQSPMGASGALVDTFGLQFDFAGDMRSIYGFELRAADNATILVQRPVSSFADMFVDLSQTPLLSLAPPLDTDLSLIAYFFNQQWRYSPPTLLDTQAIFQGSRMPYVWSPGWTGLYQGEACATGSSFGIQPIYENGPDGTGIVSFLIEGDIPPNVVSTLAAEPVISAVGSAGGSLSAGTYQVGVDNEDGTGRDRGVSPLSNIIDVTVPASGQITVTVDFPDGNKTGDVYLASPSLAQGWHYQSHLGTGVTTLPLNVYVATSAGAPDQLLDHFLLQYCLEYHAGIFGVQIAPSGVHLATLDIAGADFATNALAGRVLSLLASFDRTVDIPLANFLIASNTSGSITVGPNAAGISPPDLRDVFNDQDVVTVRMLPQDIGPDSFGDPLLINQFAPSGLAYNGILDLEAGRVARVLYNTGAGQVKGISSNSATGYVLTSQWDVLPDETSVIVITDSLLHEVLSQAYSVSNKDRFGGTVLNPTVDNLGDATWLLRVFTVDVNGNYTDSPWVPFREGFAFPNLGTGAGGGADGQVSYAG